MSHQNKFKCTSNFSGEKVRVILWGDLAHYISEDLTEN